MNEKALELINTGMKLKDVSDQTGISYSTIRKIASVNNFINDCSFLNESQIEKLKQLGLNAIVLLPLKNEKDYLADILESIDTENITRSKLIDLMKDMKDIAESKIDLQKQYENEIEYIDDKISRYNKEINSIMNRVESLKNDFEYVSIVKKTKPDIFKAYLQLIGMADGKYCLGKRINLSLWNKLRRSGVIEIESAYVAATYVSGISYIKNMEQFVANTINTFKVNDYFKRCDSVKNISPIKYVTIEKQIEPLITSLQNRINACEAEKLQKKNEILRSSQKAIKNYFAQREFRDEFSNRDTITHSKIAQGGLKWLISNDYVGTIELKKDKYQFDVIGYNNKEMIIIEAKVSYSDLSSDDKLLNYLNYCDKLYIASNNSYVCKYAAELDERVGVILLNKSFRFQKIIKEAKNVGNADQTLEHNINLKNAKLLAMTF